MNTRSTDNQNGNNSASLNVYDKSTPNTPLEYLAEAFIFASHFRTPTKEAIDILGHLSELGNINAALFLARHSSEELSDGFLPSISGAFISAIEDGYPPALLTYYESHIAKGSQTEARTAMIQLRRMGDAGSADAYWILARQYSIKGNPLAMVYGEKAEQSGFPPAIDAMRLLRLRHNILTKELARHHDSTVKSLNKRIQTLTVNLEKQKAETHLEEAALTQQISYWKQLAENAEARIATLTAESLRDEAIAQLKNTISGLEDQVLDAQCGQEKALGAKGKAEKVADDLTRRNKRLAGILRKNRIAFNEYESSSSSDGEQE